MDFEEYWSNEEIWRGVRRTGRSAFAIDYVRECVTLGVLKPGDTVSVAKCTKALDYEDEDFLLYLGEGVPNVCTPDNKVVCKDLDYFRRPFFREAVSDIFYRVSNWKSGLEEDGTWKFKKKFRKYLDSIYPLFNEVMEIEIPYEKAVYFPLPAQVRMRDLEVMGEFLSAVALKRVWRGKNVERYFLECGFIYDSVELLLKANKREQYVLANADINSTDFKLAVISAIRMCTQKNETLLQMKIKKWRKMHQQ